MDGWMSEPRPRQEGGIAALSLCIMELATLLVYVIAAAAAWLAGNDCSFSRIVLSGCLSDGHRLHAATSLPPRHSLNWRLRYYVG